MDILKQLDELESLYSGHFVLTSGKHSNCYCNFDPFLSYPDDVLSLARELWELVSPRLGEKPNLIVAPAVGGIPIGFAVAQIVERSFVWADKTSEGFKFIRKGFLDEVCDNSVLIVEDVISTGSTVRQLINEIRLVHGEVIGVVTAVSYNIEIAKVFDVPFFTLAILNNAKVWDPADCPLCKQGVPIVGDIGHGNEFKQIHPDYSGGYERLLN